MSADQPPTGRRIVNQRTISCRAPRDVVEDVEELSDDSLSEEIRQGLRLRRVMLQEASENNDSEQDSDSETETETETTPRDSTRSESETEGDR
jgi:hypothetical protein